MLCSAYHAFRKLTAWIRKLCRVFNSWTGNGCS